MTTHTLGLDIGGANLKAAHSDGTVRTVPFALWRHPHQLHEELKSLTKGMPNHDMAAVTMTGELCDCFENRIEGVRAILNAVQHVYDESRIRVWCRKGCFLDLAQARNEPISVASANWLAQAHFVAREFADRNVLLIDTGSTTTDIVYLAKGRPMTRGLCDATRLISGELVYTGVRRTPICAVLGMEVAAEVFATMLDAYLCLGKLGENEADRGTADGRPATREFAHARLARLRCTDAHLYSEAEARSLAERAVSVQWNAIARAIGRVVAGMPMLDCIVTAGSGEFVAFGAAALHLDGRNGPILSWAKLFGELPSEAACAYAVAMLSSAS